MVLNRRNPNRFPKQDHMYLEPTDQPGSNLSLGPLACPLRMIVAAVARLDTDRGIALLRETGFARDRIEVIIVEDVSRLEEPTRFLVRLRLVRGHYLDELKQARRALMSGRALIQVLVHCDEELYHAQATLSQNSWSVNASYAS
ncbi:MAG: hypothetical protein ACR2OU_04920 [Thermomicrobiales bacterium]